MYAILKNRWRAARSAGFTLVELLIVVSIGAILVTIAIPSFQWTTTIYRISTQVNGLVGDLQYARSEAIRQGMTVQMCISTDGATCSAAATSWTAGHIVITSPIAGSGLLPTVMRVQAAFTGTDTATGGGVTTVLFNRDGFAGVPSAATWNGFSSLAAPVVITVHDANDTAGVGSCIVINQIGQISVLAKGASNTTNPIPVTCT